MVDAIDQVEMLEGDQTFGVTLNGKTPFGIIWKEGRSIYLFDDSQCEEPVRAQ